MPPALGYKYILVVVCLFSEQVESSGQRATAVTMAKEKKKERRKIEKRKEKILAFVFPTWRIPTSLERGTFVLLNCY